MAKAQGVYFFGGINTYLGASLITDLNNAMLAVANYFEAVGLEHVPHSNAFQIDGTPNDILTNISTANVAFPATSWMTFAFTDDLQSTHPVYISVRLYRGFLLGITTSQYNGTHFFQTAVSTELLDGAPSGEVRLSYTPPLSSGSLGTNSLTGIQAGYGDFVRYTGDRLFVSIGTGARFTSAATPPLQRSTALFLIVARNRTKAGLPDVGLSVCGMGSANIGYTTATTEPFSYFDGLMWTTTSASASRVGGSLSLYEKGIPLVCPVYGRSPTDDALTPIQGVFTVPATVASMGSIITLDFEGTEKPYLNLGQQRFFPSNTASDAGFLLEWE